MRNGVLGLALALSLLLHLAVLNLVPEPAMEPQAEEPELLVELLAPPTPETLPEQPPEPERKQVVDLLDDDRTRRERPEQAEFLSDKDRRVDTETRARIATNIPSVPAEVALEPRPMHPPPVRTAPRTKPRRPLEETGEQPEQRPGEVSSETVAEEAEQRDTEAELRAKLAERKLDLNLSSALLSKFTVPYDPNHVKNREEGELTRLNTREFLYGSYYTRIKRLISYNWRPQPAFDRINAVTRNSPPNLVVAQVELVLDRRGKLQQVLVQKSSGYRDWDEEAIRSVQAAQPFLNPPALLVEADGTIRIPFSFIGEISYSFFQQILR